MSLLQTLTQPFRRKSRRASAQRMYAAAMANRLTADWILSGTAPRDEIFQSIRSVRSRARQLERDNDHARKFLGQVPNNVVGRGFTLQMKAADPTGTLDTAANDMIERSWLDWGKLGTCTADGRKTWKDVERLGIRGIARDGEVIVRLLRGWAGNEWRFAVQFLDPDLLDEGYNNVGHGVKPRVIMGVEIDDWNRPTGYWFRSSYEDSTRVRIPAEEIIHIFAEEVDGQIRAVSWMSSAMLRMHHLAGYEEASVVAARAGACKMGFFETPTGEDYDPADHAGDTAPVNEAAPGMFEQMPAGWKFHQYDPSHPQTQFGDYCRAQLRGMASGLGVAYHTFANDLSQVNFSSARLGTLDERDMWMVFQDWYSSHLHDRVFAAWLDMALLTQKLPLPYSKFSKFNAPHWQGRRWDWVDPKKDVDAKIAEEAAGWTSDSDICAEKGRDFEDVLRARQRVRELRKKYGEPENAEDHNQNAAI